MRPIRGWNTDECVVAARCYSLVEVALALRTARVLWAAEVRWFRPQG